MKIPPLSPDLIRAQSEKILLDMTEGKNKIAVPVRQPPATADALPPNAVPRLPASVLQVLAKLAGEGLILEMPRITEGSYEKSRGYTRTTTGDIFPVTERVIGEVLIAVDRGQVSVDEFNSFLVALAVPSKTVERAMAENYRRHPTAEATSIHDGVYRLAGGKLLKVIPSRHEVSGLWTKTAIAVAALILLLTALIRFS